MICQDLLDEIRGLAVSHVIVELSAPERDSLLDLVRQRFVGRGDGRWWWDDLACESVVVKYGDADGLALLGKLFSDDGRVVVVPTDDELPPWPAFFGEARNVIALLKELRFFEYFVMDREVRTVVFDTHHNSFVVTGALVAAAAELLRR